MGKKPDYLALAVKKVQGEDKWIDIGIAFISTRGSVTIYLSAFPLNGKIILIPLK